jgi:hypothetical protein
MKLNLSQKTPFISRIILDGNEVKLSYDLRFFALYFLCSPQKNADSFCISFRRHERINMKKTKRVRIPT